MEDKFYLAPLQGYTKVWYRNAYHHVVGDAEKYFTPFFEEHRSGGFDPRLLPELDAALNMGMNVVPQITASEAPFLIKAYQAVGELGYNEINLNMGCPFPMLVKRYKGGGLMDKPELVEKMLAGFFDAYPDASLSVKMRAGLDDTRQGLAMMRLLDKFPVSEVIIHPRLVTQQYKGTPDWNAFEEMMQQSRHRIVANGDINSCNDFEKLKNRFPEINRWMLGRGWLANPALVKDIRGGCNGGCQESTLLRELFDYFRSLVVAQNSLADQYKHQLLVQFWHYPSQRVENGNRWFRKLTKTKDVDGVADFLNESFKDVSK